MPCPPRCQVPGAAVSPAHGGRPRPRGAVGGRAFHTARSRRCPGADRDWHCVSASPPGERAPRKSGQAPPTGTGRVVVSGRQQQRIKDAHTTTKTTERQTEKGGNGAERPPSTQRPPRKRGDGKRKGGGRGGPPYHDRQGASAHTPSPPPPAGQRAAPTSTVDVQRPRRDPHGRDATRTAARGGARALDGRRPGTK